MIQIKMQSKIKLFLGLDTRGGNGFSELGRQFRSAEKSVRMANLL
jgi:hypothetical protein